MYRTSNPALNDQTFIIGAGVHPNTEAMTLEGVASKTAFLLAISSAVAIGVWTLTMPSNNAMLAVGLAGAGSIGGLIIALIVIFGKSVNPGLITTYALVEGLLLGGMSSVAEMYYPGIAMQAVLLTFCIFVGVLVIYRMRLIPYTENMRIAISAAVGGIFLIYLVSFLLSAIGFPVPYIHGSGPIGIGFSIFVVLIACLSLVADFDFVEKGVENKAPRELEWRAAFGLLVTLIWLYIEVLRLLMKLQSRR